VSDGSTFRTGSAASPEHVPPLPSAEEFRDRVAVVTGGTEGLGEHLCRTLVGLGAHVFFCARGEERGRALAQEWGERAHFVRTDLADADEAAAFVREAGRFRGHIDYLVNNAAIDPEQPFEGITVELLDQVLAVNLRAYFVVSQAALPFLEKGEGRAVVNICTTNYMFGNAGATAYNAAKSGIVGFSRSLARTFGPRGIRVNVVSPGWIMTRRQLADKVSDEDKARLLREQCVKDLMTEQHVTPLTLFLLSKAAAGICGQNIVVDGGYYMQ
jgi:NAD(P)-dependent dehydrogenase (short-subunit alcohol dehydrogenase family)